MESEALASVQQNFDSRDFSATAFWIHWVSRYSSSCKRTHCAPGFVTNAVFQTNCLLTAVFISDRKCYYFYWYHKTCTKANLSIKPLQANTLAIVETWNSENFVHTQHTAHGLTKGGKTETKSAAGKIFRKLEKLLLRNLFLPQTALFGPFQKASARPGPALSSDSRPRPGPALSHRR
jgi:hypothetical protein